MKFYKLLVALLFASTATAQIPFEQKATSVGRLGVNISNVGTIGRPDVSTNTQGNPSMEFPIGSGIEHLFEAGLWIGAYVDGQQRVSTSSLEAAKGYSTGAAGFEFTSVSGITERSILSGSPKYSGSAISHQDFVVQFTDKNTVIPGTQVPISGHTNPLGADVTLQTYAWNYSFADYFVIMNYYITNNSNKTWDSVYLGMYSDLVVRNVNITQETGTAFFNKGKGGYDSAQNAIYAYQFKGDDIDYTQSYAAIQILGSEWRKMFFHPSNGNIFTSSGFPTPQINPNFWNYSGTNPPFAKANDDQERYLKLRSGMDNTTLQVPTGPYKSVNNWIQMISTGPFVSVAPGETVNFSVALVCAKQLGGLSNNTTTDEAANRKDLTEHLGWAKRTYLGEDVNQNGKLDSTEDLNNNNKLDRYILPAPPATPHVKIIPTSNKVDIYWDNAAEKSIDPLSKKIDFEGYKLYRTNVGDDLKLNLLDAKNLVGQWDTAGNNLGFNNGFKGIRLSEPVKFDGDTATYHYHYEMNGLLNGWQYMFVITSFDQGDITINLPSLESSFNENAFRVYAGTPTTDYAAENAEEPGVYPNPYRTSAAWDGTTSRTKKVIFNNLPKNCEIRIYTSAGDVIKTLIHHADTYDGSDIRWFQNYGGANTIMTGGEHAWDLLTDNKTAVSSGVYLYTVKDTDSGRIKTGKLAILR
jgi:hypothetical protein